MSRFKRCAKVAHAKMSTFFPNLSLGQAQQLLAAGLGHNTYASFKLEDLEAFDRAAAYALLVPERAMQRAREFGIEMNQNHWGLLLDEINEKRVVGDLGIYMHLSNVYLQDRYEFLDADDPRIDELMLRHGLQEEWRQEVWAAQRHEQRHVDDGGTLPASLKSALYGEVCGYRDKSALDGLAVPVRVEFKIERVGLRLLATQEIVAIEQNGDPRPWHENEDLDDEGGMTFDGHD